jgi:NADPH:quinone reductase-like Zn-dependent oxidoreductase
VKVYATSINFGDRALIKGEPYLIRLMGGLFKPKHPIPGGDVAGRVEAVGKNVTQFQPGDKVFGDVEPCGLGAFAEYICTREHTLTLKPTDATFEEAAASCQAAVVALQGLRDKGRLQAGQKVLINGASGGIGTFAVQIAKAFGAEVTGVCSTRNVDLVRSIGADYVIDYTQQDFTQDEARYDLIFDIVANRPASTYAKVLNPQGTYLACAFSPTALFFGSVISKMTGKTIQALVHQDRTEDFVVMKELLETGKVKPVIDRRYPLSEIAEAVRYVEQEKPPGKVVITVANSGN